MITIKKKYQQPAVEEISIDMTDLLLLVESPSTQLIEIEETNVDIEEQD